MRPYLLCLCLFFGTAASAQIIPIGPFTGTKQEGYETQTRGLFLPSYTVFGGRNCEPGGKRPRAPHYDKLELLLPDFPT